MGGETLLVAWTNAGLAYVDDASANDQRFVQRRLRMRLLSRPLPKPFREALHAAARGEDVDLPLDLSWANDYEREVLAAARRIPWGQTRSYSWLARAARRPAAVRAAATAIARNPLWRLVPWHRVIYADGRICAPKFAGAACKRELLRREGVEV